MRRVLLVDDPRLAPRLARLQTVLQRSWDAILTPDEQLRFWNSVSIMSVTPTVAALEQAGSLNSAAEPIDLTVAASSSSALSLASRIAAHPESQLTVLPDAIQGADWAFSLFPLSEGAAPRIAGLFEHRFSPCLAAFGERLRAAPQETVQHVHCQLTLALPELSATDVERAFLEDVDLLRNLCGPLKTLIAVAVPASEAGDRCVSVTLTAENGTTATWVVQAGQEPAWKLTFEPGGHQAIVRSSTGEYRFETDVHSETQLSPSPLAGWDSVLRAFDDLSALRRSLKRRRVVELQTETISERSQFKSLMSATGCGLMLATLFGAIALLAAGAALDPRESLQRTSEKAGLALPVASFEEGSPELNSDVVAELPGMVRRLGHSAAPILIEQSENDGLDRKRREWLVQQLELAGFQNADSRVELFRFRGGLFILLMKIFWVMLFLPLGLFLFVQFLLLAAPSVDATRRDSRAK